jgi:hypothetical protein
MALNILDPKWRRLKSPHVTESSAHLSCSSKPLLHANTDLNQSTTKYRFFKIFETLLSWHVTHQNDQTDVGSTHTDQ